MAEGTVVSMVIDVVVMWHHEKQGDKIIFVRSTQHVCILCKLCDHIGLSPHSGKMQKSAPASLAWSIFLCHGDVLEFVISHVELEEGTYVQDLGGGCRSCYFAREYQVKQKPVCVFWAILHLSTLMQKEVHYTTLINSPSERQALKRFPSMLHHLIQFWHYIIVLHTGTTLHVDIR